MEQHPVPRNINSFQFHLIGDMTLQQFVYLAVAVGAGFMVYKIAPFPSVIKYLLAGTVGFIGFSFAFLPIQERPMDKWLVAFIRSIFAPTQYLWQKDNQVPEILTRPAMVHVRVLPQEHQEAHREANEKLKAYLSGLPKTTHESINIAEQNYIRKTLSMFGTTITPMEKVYQTQQRSSISTVGETPVKVKPSPIISVSSPVVAKIEVIPTIQPIPPKPVIIEEAHMEPNIQIQPEEQNNLARQLKELQAEKEALAKQLEQLKQEASKISTSKIVQPAPPSPEKPSDTIKFVSPKAAVNEVGMPSMPQTPNIVTGVVKDPQMKVLPNIIITIKDKNNMPLRALKTNKLGQFATATPLSNGTYLLEVEDPLKRYTFDIAQITLSGKVFLPIEIITKGEKELMREKLLKELFGNKGFS